MAFTDFTDHGIAPKCTPCQMSWYRGITVSIHMEAIMTDSQVDKNGKPEGSKPDKKFDIKIDRAEFKVHEDVLTGAQLRELPKPDIGPERDLFEVVPGGSDLKIENATPVKMRDGLRFFTAPAQINPGNT